jgi:hypothetical protein
MKHLRFRRLYAQAEPRGPPQLRRVNWRSIVGPGGASTRTISYVAPQLGQWNRVDGGPEMEEELISDWSDRIAF